jgi:phage gp29-like protein
MILREADTGRISRLVDLFHEMRQKDGKLHAVCQLAELDVASLDWDIVVEDGAGARAKSSAKKAKEALKRIPQFRERIAHLIGEARWFGFSTVETIWKKDGAAILPARMVPVHCRRFYFRESDGALRFGDNAIEDIDLVGDNTAGKYIQHTQRVNGDVAAREGLSRLLIWLALFRNWGVRDWLKLAELAWKPKREGIYEKGPGTSDKDILAAKRMLERWGDTDSAYHPKNVEYKLHWPQNVGKSSTHRELVDFCGDEMAVAVLGATDVMQPGANGARAAVETRSENKTVIRNYIASGGEETLTRQLVAPLIEMNWGPADGIHFAFNTDDTLDQLKFAQTMAAVGGAGVRISQAWIREQIGAPEPKDGEETIGGAQADASKPNQPNTGASQGNA